MTLREKLCQLVEQGGVTTATKLAKRYRASLEDMEAGLTGDQVAAIHVLVRDLDDFLGKEKAP